MDNQPRTVSEHRELARHVARERRSQPPAPVETVLVFAYDHHYARAAYADYCAEKEGDAKGADGVRRRMVYIGTSYELKRWRRDRDDPTQVVLFAGDWTRGGAKHWRFLMEMRERGFIE